MHPSPTTLLRHEKERMKRWTLEQAAGGPRGYARPFLQYFGERMQAASHSRSMWCSITLALAVSTCGWSDMSSEARGSSGSFDCQPLRQAGAYKRGMVCASVRVGDVEVAHGEQ